MDSMDRPLGLSETWWTALDTLQAYAVAVAGAAWWWWRWRCRRDHPPHPTTSPPAQEQPPARTPEDDQDQDRDDGPILTVIHPGRGRHWELGGNDDRPAFMRNR